VRLKGKRREMGSEVKGLRGFWMIEELFKYQTYQTRTQISLRQVF